MASVHRFEDRNPADYIGGDSNQWEKFLSTLTIDRLRNM